MVAREQWFRDREIYRLRTEGETLRTIGRHFGLHASRIASIVKAVERRLRRQNRIENEKIVRSIEAHEC